MSLTVSIMQPYFFPYAGYYRLLVEADVFVIYDCVQFPRRGYVHRNRLRLADAEQAWLTLPLEKCAQSTEIRDLKFRDDALVRFKSRARKFPSLIPLLDGNGPDGFPRDIADALFDFDQSPVDYLERTIAATTAAIGLSPRIVRSSEFQIESKIRGQDRILEIVQALNATRYINSPGGRALYDADQFRSRGLELAFLSEFSGPSRSSLDIMLTSGVSALRGLVSGV